MRVTHAPALVAAGFLLLAPVAHAEEKDLFHPGFASVMVGAYFPKSPDLNDGVALLLAMGLMVNPYVGFQLDFGGLSTSDDHDFNVTIEWYSVSLKLAVPVSFVEPYVLGGAGIDYKGVGGFPLYAAGGINLNFGTFQIGAEARQVWLEGDGRNFDGLMVMTKVGSRF